MYNSVFVMQISIVFVWGFVIRHAFVINLLLFFIYFQSEFCASVVELKFK